MINSPFDFYFVGGTVPSDAPCYIVREADDQLLHALRLGHYCYALTSRQMGKSSLLVRTIQRFRAESIACAMLDLTAVGQNLTVERWYASLLSMLGWQFDIEDELEAFWDKQEHLSPLQRFLRALREVVLEQVSGPIVLFVDEVDAVATLPFSADEFFAGIRECYNRRVVDPAFQRLTFALFGVFSPADLIQDTRATPFNIGRRIELTDFTPGEAKPLAVGLPPISLAATAPVSEAQLRLLKRVLYWTGGHPYLTQRLCRAVADADCAAEKGEALVDRCCADLFLSRSARERDDNLLFVRNCLLHSGIELAGLLTLYGKVRAGQRVPNDETDPRVTVLKLAGIVRTQEGRLCARNRIYERVFDRHWIATVMPDAEQRRQRAAFRAGVLRTLAASFCLMAVFGALATIAVVKAREAQENARQVSHYLYIANMNLIGAAWEQNNISHVRELLAETERSPDRNFEWGYWNRLCHLDLRTLPGHTSTLTSIAFSPDGKRIVTGSSDKTAKVWDATTGREIRTLRGHTDEVTSVAFSPDGKRIVTGSADHTAKVWDATTGQEIRTLRGHSERVSSVAFAPDGTLIGTGSFDNSVALWDATSGRKVRTIPYKDMINSLVFTPDSKRIVVGAAWAILWDVATGRMIRMFKGHRESTPFAAISPDGRLIATGSYDHTAKIWDTHTGKELRTLQGHTGTILSVAFDRGGTRLLTGSTDGTARVWNVKTGEDLLTLKGHTSYVYQAVFSPNGTRIATASPDYTAKLWDASIERGVPVLRGHSDRLLAVAVSPDGKRIATGSEDWTIRLWDARTAMPLQTFTGHRGPVWTVAFSPDGKRLVSASYDYPVKNSPCQESLRFDLAEDHIWLAPGDVRVWDVATGKPILTLKGHTLPVWSAAYSPDGTRIVTASYDRTVRVWDANTGRELLTLRGFADSVQTVAISPDSKWIVTGSFDRGGNVSVWDTATGQKIREMQESAAFPFAHHSAVYCVAFSRDGTRIVSGSYDRTARVWDAATGKLLLTLKGHTEPVFSAAFSPDGTRIVTSGQDRTARLWDAATGREVLTLRGHTHQVTSVAFAPDGKWFVTASLDHTARIWSSLPVDVANSSSYTQP